MILCQALVLQGQGLLACGKKLNRYQFHSVKEVESVCRFLYGNAVVPVCQATTTFGKLLKFVHKDDADIVIDQQKSKESEEEFWARILADAAQQIREQNAARARGEQNIRQDTRREPPLPPTPGPTETGTITNTTRTVTENTTLDDERERPENGEPTHRRIRQYTYNGNGQWEIRIQ